MSAPKEIIIIGQGLSGTFLSFFLHQANIKFLVYDTLNKSSASQITSGVINPVTGRRIVRTWMIENVMPFAVQAYQQVENFLNTSFIKQCNILDFHATAQMQQAFDERVQEETYLKIPEYKNEWKDFFNYSFSVGETNPCWLINVKLLLDKWRAYLLANNLLIEENFSVDQIKDYQEQTIIFCDGIANAANPYFNALPYSANKGETLIAEINDLPNNNIYKKGCSIVPWQNNLWWIGSTYNWNFENDLPTESFRIDMENKLKDFLKLPYKIVHHFAAIRPANIERRPFVGLHPIHKNIGILNGMGTKGCSLSPYFAHELTEHLINQKPINPNADVQRFSKILSKQ